MIHGAYVLCLYCDGPDCPGRQGRKMPYAGRFEEITGDTYGECVRKARHGGWQIGKKRQLCPQCSGKPH